MNDITLPRYPKVPRMRPYSRAVLLCAIAWLVTPILGVDGTARGQGEPPAFRPKPGDRAHIHYGDDPKPYVPVGKDLAGYQQLAKARSQETLAELEKKGVVVLVENDVSIQVKSHVEPPAVPRPAIEAKILEGMHTGRTYFIPAFVVAKGNPIPEKVGPGELTTKKKRAVYADWWRADHAAREAEARAPKGKAQEIRDQTFKRMVDVLPRRHGITKQQLDKILDEGLSELWRLPPDVPKREP